MDLNVYLLVVVLAVGCFGLPANFAEDDYDFEKKNTRKHRKGRNFKRDAVSQFGADDADEYRDEDETLDYPDDGSVEVSHEQKGVEDVLKNMFQHMIKFDKRLAMLENRFASLDHTVAQQAKQALMLKTPVQCREYKWLNDSSRHFSNGFVRSDDKCDTIVTIQGSNIIPKSPDWAGEGWYRFGSPAGRLANKDEVKFGHRCGVYVPGYLKDTSSLPNTIGETRIGTVTNYYGWADRTVKITKCSMYYVFKLKDVPSICNFRYCSA